MHHNTTMHPGYAKEFQSSYQSKPYYRADRDWNDYEPAYNYAYTARQQHRDASFDAVENDLERGWDKTKSTSRLAWSEAREAVRDGWHAVERILPGDADRDGR